MLYTLLTKDEINSIELILKDHLIKYEVSVNEELIHEQNESMKHVVDRHGQIRRTNALYNLVIENEEFSKIPKSSQKKLEKYNIFPEFTDISFHAEPHVIDSRFKIVNKKTNWTTRVLSVLGLCFLLYLGLMWVDDYVIQVFPSSSTGIFYGDKRIFQGRLFE